MIGFALLGFDHGVESFHHLGEVGVAVIWANILIGTPATGADCPEAAFAKRFPTSLKRLTKSDFDRLAGHGYAVAMDTERRYGLG